MEITPEEVLNRLVVLDTGGDKGPRDYFWHQVSQLFHTGAEWMKILVAHPHPLSTRMGIRLMNDSIDVCWIKFFEANGKYYIERSCRDEHGTAPSQIAEIPNFAAARDLLREALER